MSKFVALTGIFFVLTAFQIKRGNPEIPAEVKTLLDKHGCAACHSLSRKMVGPSWSDIAAKKYSAKKIAQLVEKPVPSNWPGYVPMAAQKLPKAELKTIAEWLSKLK